MKAMRRVLVIGLDPSLIRVMLDRLRFLARERRDFAFETTLSGRAHALWLQELRASGYIAHLAFLSLPSPDLAVARVEERVRQGGHHVPEEVVRRRYVAGLSNFFNMYHGVVNSWQLYDNSELVGPRLVASGGRKLPLAIADQAAWDRLRMAK